MFLSWIRDQEEKHKFSEDYSILTGSFANPTMAARMRNQDNRTHMEMEDFDQKVEQTEELLAQQLNTKKGKKKKRKLKMA